MKLNDNNEDEEELSIHHRMRCLKQDMELLDARKVRMEQDRQLLVLKLIAQREQLLSLQEQDE